MQKGIDGNIYQEEKWQFQKEKDIFVTCSLLVNTNPFSQELYATNILKYCIL